METADAIEKNNRIGNSNSIDQEETETKNRENDRERSGWGNFGVKCLLFVLTVVSLTILGGCIYYTLYLAENDFFESNRENYVRNSLQQQIWHDYYQWNYGDVDLDQMEYITRFYGDEVWLELKNTDTGEVLWSDYPGGEALYTYSIYTYYFRSVDNGEYTDRWLWNDIDRHMTGSYYLGTFDANGSSELLEIPAEPDRIAKTFQEGGYSWTFYINPEIYFMNGVYARIIRQADYLFSYGNFILISLGCSAVVFIISFLLLMISVGHRNGRTGFVPSHLSGIPMDIYVVGYLFLALGIVSFYIWLWEMRGDSAAIAAEVYGVVIFCFIESLLGVIFLAECMNRFKRHTFFGSMLIVRFFRAFGSGLRNAAGGLRHSMEALIVFTAVTILEFLGLLIVINLRSMEFLMFAWGIEKILILVGIGIVTNSFQKIQTAVEAVAGGNYEYKINEGKLVPGHRSLGEKLNHIASGMNMAVEERLKSERLKTELITNVSHDIKTPLTSIINYSELIVSEGENGENTKEYAEVLNRQSKRLKKLLEDLLEASKAATGNIEVNLQTCDIGVMLTQTIGEFEDKFREKGLTLVEKRPEEPVWIKADGRHLWRVLDNLMNNIYKYSMENSRVYLTMEKNERNVTVTFRNMSKYELDVSAEELTERFVRGDKSRNQEGNGLGLSIASSLTTIQNGTIQIAVDGDLFKVILSFPLT